MTKETPYDLEAYLRHELSEGKIDFVFRASSFDGSPVEIYIHPIGRHGMTTPSLVVRCNALSVKETT
jgi:hypothetical protein